MSDTGDSLERIAAHLRSCEEELLNPAVRSDRARVNELLAENFVEFGASGRVWTRDEILELMANEVYTAPVLENFHCELIGEGVALVTYRTVRAGWGTELPNSTLRSSIWTKNLNMWRLRFHQGTRESKSSRAQAF